MFGLVATMAFGAMTAVPSPTSRGILLVIYEDKKGNIWTSSAPATNQGWALSRYDEKSLYKSLFHNTPVLKPTVTEIANKPMIFGIIEDDKGNIWFGADGVYRYDGNTLTDFKRREALRPSSCARYQETPG